MPIPGAAVIPDGWDTHHRPVATAAMKASCTVTRATTGTYNSVTLQIGGDTTTTVYTGPCRVQELTSANLRQFAGQTTTTRPYLVAIRYDAAPVLVDDIVMITAASDAALAGRKLRVTDAQFGSQQWERDLTCEDFEG